MWYPKRNVIPNFALKVTYIIAIYVLTLACVLSWLSQPSIHIENPSNLAILTLQNHGCVSPAELSHLNGKQNELLVIMRVARWERAKFISNIDVDVSFVPRGVLIRTIAILPFQPDLVATTSFWNNFRDVQRHVDSLFEDATLLSNLTIPRSEKRIFESHLIRKVVPCISYYF